MLGIEKIGVRCLKDLQDLQERDYNDIGSASSYEIRKLKDCIASMCTPSEGMRDHPESHSGTSYI